MLDIPIAAEQLQEAIQNRFQCARCGACCKGDGIVRLTPVEIDRMAGVLQIAPRRFLKDFAARLDGRQWVLKDRLIPDPRGIQQPEKWCIFLERHPGGGYACRLGDAKPRQCHSFPYDWTNPDSFENCAGLRILMKSVASGE